MSEKPPYIKKSEGHWESMMNRELELKKNSTKK